MRQLSIEEARGIALTAQGFADPRPPKVGRAQLRRAIGRLGVLQLDSVNVLCRSHYLPLFARLGPYSRATLDDMAWGKRRDLFEYWGHRASLLPMELYPLMRWKMQAAARHRWVNDIRRWRENLDPGMYGAPWAVFEGMIRLGADAPAVIDEVKRIVAKRGPIDAGSLDLVVQRRLEQGGLWNWHDGKVALEWLFYLGTVTVAARRGFERLYALTEDVLPAKVLAAPVPSAANAQRELVRIAAQAQGVATEIDLRDYFHLPPAQAKVAITELVDGGELTKVRVDGLGKPAYLWNGAQARPVAARALLSPFDSLIWNRDRTELLFGFHYRISIYLPAAKRTHGYFVLPFLLGDRIVARVDLKADRANGSLVVPVVTGEPGIDKKTVAAELAEELRQMAQWLELGRVAVSGLGDLAGPLAAAVGAQS
jgi:uncharacterized protein YcaQ